MTTLSSGPETLLFDDGTKDGDWKPPGDNGVDGIVDAGMDG